MTKLEMLRQRKEDIKRKLQELKCKLENEEDETIIEIMNDSYASYLEDLTNINYKIYRLECDCIGIDGTLYF